MRRACFALLNRRRCPSWAPRLVSLAFAMPRISISSMESLMACGSLRRKLEQLTWSRQRSLQSTVIQEIFKIRLAGRLSCTGTQVIASSRVQEDTVVKPCGAPSLDCILMDCFLWRWVSCHGGVALHQHGLSNDCHCYAVPSRSADDVC